MRSLFVMFAALAVMAPTLPALAEDSVETEPVPEGWSVSSDINLTLTQNAYSDNWDGSETGALSWALNSNTLAESQLSPSVNNKNTLKLAFGQTHSQDKESKVWLKPSTTTDLIDFETVFRFTYGWAVDPFAAGRVESRFVDNRNPAETVSFNPTTFTESFGVARVIIKEEDREWTTRLGGAVRQHIDRNVLPEGADEDSDERETETTSDTGIEFVSEYRSPLLDGAVTFTSDLTVFQALSYSESDKLEGEGRDDWKSPDVNWENSFTASITEYINVNLYLQALYDKQVDGDIRLKETLSLGFSLTLL